MATSPWNPDQYARFRSERSQPFYDLLALVQRKPGMRVADLGCGTGELTQVVHRELLAGETVGIDSSESMLARSAAFAGDGLRFEHADIQQWDWQKPFDLVFSNAAMHWLPDHDALLARLTQALGPDGQLAFQVPANETHPSHAVATEVALEEPFRSALGGFVRESPVLAPEDYAVLLDRLGYAEQHVRLQIYGHHLASSADVIEWTKGTMLTAYEERLPADLYARFLERYRQHLLGVIGDVRPYFYTYRRVLCWGRR